MAIWQLVALLTWFLLVCFDMAHSCSWSNEGCSEDSECCSNSCHRAHEGTNARCRHSTLGERCVFDYHCQDTLTCGRHFNCCSPYWKMCVKNSDCCDETHVCRSADGFFYNRCLYPTSTSQPQGHPCALLTYSVLFIAMITWRQPIMNLLGGAG
ncbi:unnamed protein product [Lymnaea stagnalis]|uniref:Uncharacterized protein n=1 Tax=Lymnaea stagnalis TaxID=6523 RepID=A0AAV2HSL6_LYMST